LLSRCPSAIRVGVESEYIKSSRCPSAIRVGVESEYIKPKQERSLSQKFQTPYTSGYGLNYITEKSSILFFICIWNLYELFLDYGWTSTCF